MATFIIVIEDVEPGIYPGNVEIKVIEQNAETKPTNAVLMGRLIAKTLKTVVPQAAVKQVLH